MRRVGVELASPGGISPAVLPATHAAGRPSGVRQNGATPVASEPSVDCSWLDAITPYGRHNATHSNIVLNAHPSVGKHVSVLVTAQHEAHEAAPMLWAEAARCEAAPTALRQTHRCRRAAPSPPLAWSRCSMSTVARGAPRACFRGPSCLILGTRAMRRGRLCAAGYSGGWLWSRRMESARSRAAAQRAPGDTAVTPKSRASAGRAPRRRSREIVSQLDYMVFLRVRDSFGPHLIDRSVGTRGGLA